MLPVSASLRKHGASKGATLSFLISTPQTGVDSIFATQALLGPVFVVYRVLTALVSGVLGGTLAEWATRHETDDVKAVGHCHHCEALARDGRLKSIVTYGFQTLPRDIGRAMLLGIVVSGVLTALVPANYFADKLGSNLVSMVVMMIIGIPLYVCSTGSIPVAFAFLGMGISPGAALVFLISGPATNAAALTTVWTILGKRTTFIYLATIAISSLAAGLLMDWWSPGMVVLPDLHDHGHGVHGLKTIAGIVLLFVLLPALRRRKSAPVG